MSCAFIAKDKTARKEENNSLLNFRFRVATGRDAKAKVVLAGVDAFILLADL